VPSIAAYGAYGAYSQSYDFVDGDLTALDESFIIIYF
jgi:hypothetical protein